MRFKNKRGFEFSFAWLFSIIVGAVILFLAIYGAMRFVKVGEYTVGTETAKALSIFFEPMETGLAAGKSDVVTLREETRVYNDCQKISLSSKMFRGEWSERSEAIDIGNKYVFSNDTEEGERFYLFSKPFEMPWKVSELIFFNSDSYCFVDSPDFVEREVSGLNLQNVKLDDSCIGDEIRVCFSGRGGGGCDVIVREPIEGDEFDGYEYGVVEKEGERLWYIGDSLMYAAIFSSPDIYECNVQRLMIRLKKQALLFKEEADFLVTRCGTLPLTGLDLIAEEAGDFEDARLGEFEGLVSIKIIADQVDRENENAECNLW
ncbi:MAG: hypothetical protein PVG65_01605 [Candidatus Thorarchaeota archaeon]|jgi:hypothetical protein